MATNYDHEEPGRIRNVEYGPEDHGILTCMAQVKFDNSGEQGFGGLALTQENGPLFLADLCGVFGVERLEQLEGRACTALYLLPGYNERIAALRGPRGTFDLHAWRQKMRPGLPSFFEERRTEMRREVHRIEQQLQERREALAVFEREHLSEKGSSGRGE